MNQGEGVNGSEDWTAGCGGGKVGQHKQIMWAMESTSVCVCVSPAQML